MNPAIGQSRRSHACAKIFACWPIIALPLFAMTVASTDPGYRARANAAAWVNALSAASGQIFATARTHVYPIKAAPPDSVSEDSPYLVERDSRAAREHLGASGRSLIALVVSLLLVGLAALDRFDEVIQQAVTVEAILVLEPVPDCTFAPPTQRRPPPPRFHIQCLGAQDEIEIIARHNDRPAMRGVIATLKHSIN